MKSILRYTLLICAFLALQAARLNAQEQADAKKIVDLVWLKDGSKLSGTILKWELERGMEFKLITGATMIIPKADIDRVQQSVAFAAEAPLSRYRRPDGPREYSFREKGVYNAFSGFFNVSELGGAGLSYAIGYRWNKRVSAGIGVAMETNDFFNDRDLIPVYAEFRGFLQPKNITPYYAFKLGYSFAVKKDFDIDAKGGLYMSPEVGVRFGGKWVNYYLGVEYKIQNATWTSTYDWDGNGSVTDVISYRRLELRTGLLF